MSEDELKRYLEVQCEEIRKHKWIESEKVGYDLGQCACIDWIKKHAASFRGYWESRCFNLKKDDVSN
jgi:hypothetical protein